MRYLRCTKGGLHDPDKSSLCNMTKGRFKNGKVKWAFGGRNRGQCINCPNGQVVSLEQKRR